MAIDRQKVYLQAVAAYSNVKVINGFYSKNKTLAPAIKECCTTCSVAVNGYVPVVKLEEKRSDVNLAIEALSDAYEDAVDSFFFITGDSDQIGTIEKIRNHLGKRVCVFNPQEAFSMKLKTIASYYQNIPRDLPARCQLPDKVPVGSNGKSIHCPPAWK